MKSIRPLPAPSRQCLAGPSLAEEIHLFSFPRTGMHYFLHCLSGLFDLVMLPHEHMDNPEAIARQNELNQDVRYALDLRKDGVPYQPLYVNPFAYGVHHVPTASERRRIIVARREPPPWLPGVGPAPETGGADAPRILSPRPGVVLCRAAAGDAREAVALRARPAPDASKVYWFAGREFLGATAPLEPLAWLPSPGSYEITALDDRGRSSLRSLTVESAR